MKPNYDTHNSTSNSTHNSTSNSTSTAEYWRLIDWKEVCRHATGIQKAWEAHDFREEYDSTLDSFIHTATNLQPLAQQWWNSLQPNCQYQFLAARLEEIKTLAAQLQAAIEKVEAER
jgi:hypothetical protein